MYVQCLCQIQHLAPEYYFKVFQPLPVQPVTCILLFGLKPCLTTCTLALHVQQQPPFCCSLVAYYFILFWALGGKACGQYLVAIGRNACGRPAESFMTVHAWLNIIIIQP